MELKNRRKKFKTFQCKLLDFFTAQAPDLTLLLQKTKQTHRLETRFDEQPDFDSSCRSVKSGQQDAKCS